MPSHSRRSVLAAAGVAGSALLAGCSVGDSLGGSTRLTYTLDADRIGSSLVPSMLWEPPEEPNPVRPNYAETVPAAVAGERPTTYGYPPVPDGEYVERDGTFYRLSVVTTGLERIERPVLTLSWVGDAEEMEDPPERVRHADLPPLDRHAVKPAYFAARAREFDGGAPWDLVEEGGYVYRRHDAAESELAPEPAHDYVEFNGTVLDVSVTLRDLAEPARTGVATRIADSRAAFARALDGELVDARIDGDDLSEDQRLMLDRDQHEETTPLSAEFRDLLARLHLRDLLSASAERAPTAANGRRLALDDEYYRYGLYVNPAD